MLRSAPTHINTRGERDVLPLKGSVFIDTHMGTHRSPRARKIVCTIEGERGEEGGGGTVKRLPDQLLSKYRGWS